MDRNNSCINNYLQIYRAKVAQKKQIQEFFPACSTHIQHLRSLNRMAGFFNQHLPLNMDRIEKLLDFLKAAPQDNFLRHALALEYVKQGEDQKAQTLFEAILAESPEYVGSYYHLGMLLERTGNIASAIQGYEKGMEAAKKAKDPHAYNELRAACDELEA
jgi:tetratricopeptide (TPR) repeat protein